jgi:hypothetical protein
VVAAKDDESEGEGTPIDRFKRLVGEGSLYAPSTFSQGDVAVIAGVIGSLGLQIDFYCPMCNAPSTFQFPPVKTDGLNVLDPFNPPPTPAGVSRAPLPISNIDHLKRVARALELRCARNASHRVEFILRAIENLVSPGTPMKQGAGSIQMSRGPEYSYTFVKIGQYPQHAELVAGRLKAVSKIADPLDMKELRRAVGLMSHDVAIGAFVYLRRVFERIIGAAWRSAVDAGETLPDPTRLRMDGKIAALKNHLPGIIVNNAKVYGVLSVGLHELTEEECARVYPLVEESVIAMLEETHTHAEKQKREKRIAEELGRISGQMGKSS